MYIFYLHANVHTLLFLFAKPYIGVEVSVEEGISKVVISKKYKINSPDEESFVTNFLLPAYKKIKLKIKSSVKVKTKHNLAQVTLMDTTGFAKLTSTFGLSACYTSLKKIKYIYSNGYTHNMIFYPMWPQPGLDFKINN